MTRYFDLTTEPTILQVADAEKYQDYAIEYRFVSSKTFKETHKDEPRMSVRFGTWLDVWPSLEKFVIDIKRGARRTDVEWALKAIQDVKAGHFASYPWREVVSKKVAPGETYFTISLGYPIAKRRYRSAELHQRYDRDQFVLECREPACDQFSTYHLSYERTRENLLHRFAPVERGEDEPSVEVTRLESKPRWMVDVRWGDELSVEQASVLASDLQWSTAEAKKLNAKSYLWAAEAVA